MAGSGTGRLARLVVGAVGVVVLVAAGGIGPVGAASRVWRSPSAPVVTPLQITTSPALQPAFDPTVPDYVSVCTAATPIVVSVVAPAGTTVSVDGSHTTRLGCT